MVFKIIAAPPPPPFLYNVSKATKSVFFACNLFQCYDGEK